MSGKSYWGGLWPDYADGVIDGGGGGGGGETVPPTDSASVSFSSDYQVAKDQAISVNVQDAASAMAFAAVSIKMSDRIPTEEVYAGTGLGTGFKDPYKKYSTISGSGAAGVGWTLSIRRDDGWPKGVSITTNVRSVDAKGNVKT